MTDAFGNLLPELQVTSPTRAADQWLTVTAFGRDGEQSWNYGPFAAEGAIFTVPVVVDTQAQGAGLVRVTARLEVVEPGTDRRMASRRTAEGYVIDAGLEGERWFDEAAAEAAVIRNLAFEVPTDVQIEGLVGFEVVR